MTFEQIQETRTFRYKLERVSKGYVRVTVHSDDVQELLTDWKVIHQMLEQQGEKVEKYES